MDRVMGVVLLDNSILFQHLGPGESPEESEPGISLRFRRTSGPLLARRGRCPLQDFLELNSIRWLWQRGETWYLDLDQFRQRFESPPALDWATGVAVVEPRRVGSIDLGVYVSFDVYKADHTVNRRTRIFLSHKGADKPLVERYYRLLKELGFDPWLDKEDVTAGMELHRALRAGFDMSCAAVFFLTPRFKDESFLRSEVNYAKEEQQKKGDQFRIITLVFPAKKKQPPPVPPLLSEFAYVTPKGHLDAVREIVRALPVELGAPRWRAELDSHPRPDPEG